MGYLLPEPKLNTTGEFGMRLVILGAPGAGKGTQAVLLSEKLKVPHVSTGDIFRTNIKEETPLGRLVKGYIDSGALVPDEVTIAIVKDRLSKEDCGNGFILDGFPRTIPQAQSLDDILSEMGTKLDYAVNIIVKDEVIIKRLSGRRICPRCNMSYHVDFNAPAENGICDNCGAKLIQRDDDSEETVINRLSHYHEQTEPLIGYYRERGILKAAYGREQVADTTAGVQRALGIKE